MLSYEWLVRNEPLSAPLELVEVMWYVSLDGISYKGKVRLKRDLKICFLL